MVTRRLVLAGAFGTLSLPLMPSFALAAPRKATLPARSSAEVVSSRDSLVLGSYDPGPSTTGVLPGTTLTARTSGAVVAGATYENIDFRYQVVLPAGSSTITFRNCRFSGTASAPASFEGLVKAHNANHCLGVFIDCTFRPQVPHWYWIGVHGHSFTALRCDLSYLVDTFSLFNTHDPNGPLNVKIHQSYVHDFTWWNQATNPHPKGDGSHGEPVQLQSGSGVSIRGNNFQAFTAPNYFNTYYGTNHSNAGLMIKPDVGMITGLVIADNLIAGGGVSCLNFAHDGPDRYLATAAGTVAQVYRNRFVRNSSRLGFEIMRPTTPYSPGIDFGTGSNQNVFSDDGTPVSISNGG